jgi:hypothetical protein
MELFFEILLSGLLAYFLWVCHDHNSDAKTLEIWFQEVLKEFRATEITSASKDFAFHGQSAEVVKVEKTGGVGRSGPDRSNFTVVIFAKNSAGEFFMFRKTSTDKPLFKHIEKRIAINVLHLNKSP